MPRDDSPDTIFDPDSGPTLDGYEITRVLACKERSQLFLGQSQDSHQSVFIKWFSSSANLVTTELERMAQHALEAQYIDHPRIVPVFEVHKKTDELIIISEWVESEDLASILKRQGKFRPEAVIAFFRQVVEGLCFMSKQSVIHGDIRPGHLLLVNGQLKLIGFGQSPKRWTSSGRRMTGPAAYLPPEIIHGKASDFRSDMYALACTLYELVTGKTPFGSLPDDAIMACHAHEPFPSLRHEAPTAPATLDALLRKMTSKDPGRRPTSYEELQERMQYLGPQGSGQQGPAPVLVVEEGRQRGMTVEIPPDGLLLGRHIGHGFVIDDGRISREHAKITRQGLYTSLTDLGSRNGTKLNGLVIQQADLHPGDRIFIGDTVLRVEGCLHPVPKPSLSSHQVHMAVEHQLSERRQFEDAVVPDSSVTHHPDDQIFRNPNATAQGAPYVKALLSVATDTLSGLPFKDCSGKILSGLCSTFEADNAYVFHIQDGRIAKDTSSETAPFEATMIKGARIAFKDRLSLATSVQTPENGLFHLVLAPVWEGDNVLGYIGFHRRNHPFVKADLRAVEQVADLMQS